MATRAKKSAKPYMQYSKKMATFVCFAWLFFRLLSLAAMTYKPDIAEQVNQWIGGVDTVMFANLGFYSGNSSVEKVITKYYEAKIQTADKEEESENS